MRKPRTHIAARKPTLPCLVFTLDELVFLKKALVPLEQMLLTQEEMWETIDLLDKIFGEEKAQKIIHSPSLLSYLLDDL